MEWQEHRIVQAWWTNCWISGRIIFKHQFILIFFFLILSCDNHCSINWIGSHYFFQIIWIQQIKIRIICRIFNDWDPCFLKTRPVLFTKCLAGHLICVFIYRGGWYCVFLSRLCSSIGHIWHGHSSPFGMRILLVPTPCFLLACIQCSWSWGYLCCIIFDVSLFYLLPSFWCQSQALQQRITSL